MQVLVAIESAVDAERCCTILKTANYSPIISYRTEAIAALHEETMFDFALVGCDTDPSAATAMIKALRKAKNPVPVIAILKQQDSFTVASVLNAGADGCLDEESLGVELIPRINSVIRRCLSYQDTLIRLGDVVVNTTKKMVEVGGVPINLTIKEYGVIEALATRRGKPISKEQLMDALYSGMDEPDVKIIDVFVCKLRKKLAAATGGESYIRTVWGKGYMAVAGHAMIAAQ